MVVVLLQEQVYKDFPNKVHNFCISSSLDVNLYKTKGMICGQNKSKFNEKGFYLGKDQIKLTHGYFRPSHKSIDGHLEERSYIWCHMLGSQIPIYSNLWCSQPLHMVPKFEGELWNYLIGMLLRKEWGYIWSLMSKCILTSYHILLATFGEFPIKLYALKLAFGFEQWHAHKTTSRGWTRIWNFTQNNNRLESIMGFITMGIPWHPNNTSFVSCFSSLKSGIVSTSQDRN